MVMQERCCNGLCDLIVARLPRGVLGGAAPRGEHSRTHLQRLPTLFAFIVASSHLL